MNNEPILPEEEISPEPESQPEPKNPTRSLAAVLFDYLEMFAWSVFAVLILFTFAIRLCRVDGQSMENTLENGQNLLLYNIAYTPRQDDIVVFHLTKPEVGLQKTLVKRVIATGGQKVEVNFRECTVTVDGERYADSHSILKNFSDVKIGYYTLTAEHDYNAATGIFSVTVPEHCLFVMGDNRNNSKDSRDNDVSFIDERCVLGKAVLRLYPFTVFS